MLECRRALLLRAVHMLDETRCASPFTLAQQPCAFGDFVGAAVHECCERASAGTSRAYDPSIARHPRSYPEELPCHHVSSTSSQPKSTTPP
jgi:hypothetical protein